MTKKYLNCLKNAKKMCLFATLCSKVKSGVGLSGSTTIKMQRIEQIYLTQVMWKQSITDPRCYGVMASALCSVCKVLQVFAISLMQFQSFWVRSPQYIATCVNPFVTHGTSCHLLQAQNPKDYENFCQSSHIL